MGHFSARAGSGGEGAENQQRFIPADRTLFPLRRDASPPPVCSRRTALLLRCTELISCQVWPGTLVATTANKQTPLSTKINESQGRRLQLFLHTVVKNRVADDFNFKTVHEENLWDAF